MAGLGRKVFTAGDVLTASDVQNYLMDQTVMNFAGTAARSSAIATPTTGMTTYIGTTGTASIPQIETYTGSAWQTPYGVTQLAVAQFAGASTLSINNVFDSTKYQNYSVFFNMISQTTNGGAIYFRLRNAGSDLATSIYDNHILGLDASANNFAGTQSYHYLGALAADYGMAEIQLIQPYANSNNRVIKHTSLGYNGNQIYYTGGTRVISTTVADGFTILPASGVFSGTIRVYGYRNS
jgi:hypothetical protein